MKNAIQLFENRKVRSVWDAEQGKWYISIVDVIGVLTESVDGRKYWNKLKQRLKEEGSELVTNCHQLKMPAADGKMRAFIGVPASRSTLLRQLPPLRYSLAALSARRVATLPNASAHTPAGISRKNARGVLAPVFAFVRHSCTPEKSLAHSPRERGGRRRVLVEPVEEGAQGRSLSRTFSRERSLPGAPRRRLTRTSLRRRTSKSEGARRAELTSEKASTKTA